MKHIIATFILSLSVQLVQAETFLLPENGDSVVGAVSLTTTRYEDTISDLARLYDQGFREMQYANPNVDPWLPGEGTEVIIPSHYVLPDAPRVDIVVNVPEMRLYYYPKPKKGERAKVITFPISIGRQDWATPYGQTTIISRIKDPTWTPPKSIKKEHLEMGDPLPDVVPAGPDNPLGLFALRLGKRGYLIHGTNKPSGLGMRVTHGCIRMYPKDIERMYSLVKVGTKVNIIDQPYKAGWLNGKLYLEAHPPLEEAKLDSSAEYQRLVNSISKASEQGNGEKIDWNSIKRITEKLTGLPAMVGVDVQTSTTEEMVIVDKSDSINHSTSTGVVVERREEKPLQKQSSYSDLF